MAHDRLRHGLRLHASLPATSLEIKDEAGAVALAVRAADAAAPETAAPSAQDRIERALVDAAGPITVAELRTACRIRTATLCEILTDLVEQGRVRRTATGYLAAGR